MMMEIDNNDYDNEQRQCIVKCEEEEQNGGRMNGGGDEKKKATKQRTSDEEEEDIDDDVESVDEEDEEKTRERMIMGEERREGEAKSTISSNSCGMIDEDEDEGVEMKSTKSAMIVTTIINNNNTIHGKEGGDDVGIKGKCESIKNNEKERVLECFGSADDDDGIDCEGDEFDDCGKKDVDWHSSVGGDFARGGKAKKRKNSNDNNDQNEENIVNGGDGRARIASRSEIAPAGIPDDDDEEEEMNDGGGGMSDLFFSNKNNHNDLMMNLNGIEGYKRANVRIVFSDITNNSNYMKGGGSEMSKRRSCNDNENNDTLSSSSILFGIGKRSRIESEDRHGSAFRRVDTLPLSSSKNKNNDGRQNGCESGNRFDFGSDVVAVKKEKTDDVESDGMMVVGDVAANNNNKEVEMSDVDRAEDGFEFGVKSEKDGSQIQSCSPPINMHREDDESDYEECVWSCSGDDDNNNNIMDDVDGNSSDASYHPSPIETSRRQARPSQHRDENAAKACKRRGSVVRSDTGDQEAEDDDEIVNYATNMSDINDGTSRRPNGYWNNFSNVERELRSFIERMGEKIEPGRMPTFTQLQNEGCSSLNNAIHKYGGMAAVGERLGLAPAPTKPHGYWNDFSNVEKEIRAFIERMGDKIEPGRMPTATQLQKEGCGRLEHAIRRHGGMGAIAERLGLAASTSMKPRRYWDDFSNVERELQSFIERLGNKIEPGAMPTKRHLQKEGCNGLMNAIQKYGGMGVVAERMGLAASTSMKPRGYWDDFNNVERELRSFIERMGDKIGPGRMPTFTQLQNGRCNSLRCAIEKYGGFVAVAERLGLSRAYSVKPRGYWDDFSNVEKELRSFIERMGDKIEPGRMPTERHLQDGGCGSLATVIQKHGGIAAVGERLGLSAPLPMKPAGYWDDFSNVEKEIRSFLERMGDKIKPGRMPTFTQLQNGGCNSLKKAIQQHGGFAAVGERLGLAVSRSASSESASASSNLQQHWESLNSISMGMYALMARAGDMVDSGTMSMSNQALHEVSNALQDAVNRCSGDNVEAAWRDLQERSISMIPVANYWDDFSNIEKDLQSFFNHMGDKIDAGRMPTEQQLIDAGFISLNSALSRHGGSAAVGERLGLAPPS